MSQREIKKPRKDSDATNAPSPPCTLSHTSLPSSSSFDNLLNKPFFLLIIAFSFPPPLFFFFNSLHFWQTVSVTHPIIELTEPNPSLSITEQQFLHSTPFKFRAFPTCCPKNTDFQGLFFPHPTLFVFLYF